MLRKLVAMAGVAASREPLGASVARLGSPFAGQWVLQAPRNLLVPERWPGCLGSPGCRLAHSWQNSHPTRSLERVQLRVASHRANLKKTINRFQNQHARYSYGQIASIGKVICTRHWWVKAYNMAGICTRHSMVKAAHLNQGRASMHEADKHTSPI